jgi:hypothetical protein
VLIEGDIQIPLAQHLAWLKGGPQPNATFGGVTFWAGNVVPYDFVTSGGGAVSAANQTAAINAMTAIATRAGITFRAAVASDANRIRFQNSTFNNSPVGVQNTQPQIINIANWGTQIIICHEIYHSLGFWHEQSRADRAPFITINYNNICGSSSSVACVVPQCCTCTDPLGFCIPCAFNFDIQPLANVYGPYDFDSFMHYGRNSFSCNGSDTITVNAPWNAQWQSAIGQRTHFSYLDAITCRALYPFPNDRWLDRTYVGTSSGTFEQPYKNTILAGALAGVPSGGTLFIKNGGSYSAVGTYNTAVTIMAPNGAAILGN